jgi:hypothetical protein
VTLKEAEHMRTLLSALLLATTAIGCANQQLKLSTIRQTSTLPDVQERQVIENFARLASNSGNLPFFAVANQGSASVSDEGATGFAINAVSKAFPVWNISAASANRSITENWQLVPENNPDRLKAMRAAYLSVLDPPAVEIKDASLLNAVIEGDPSYALRDGWVCTGRWWEVPKHAWLVARCGSTYAWVMPADAAEFSRFVLLILHIETVQPASGAGATAELAPRAIAPATPASPFAPRLFDEPNGVNSGLFFIPRPR